MASHPAAGKTRGSGSGRADLRSLSVVFLKRGNLTFGSAAALAALLRDDLVDRFGWIDDPAFAFIYTLARVTPGTNMMALYAGLGWRIRRWSGAVSAMLCASIPPSIAVVLLTLLYEASQGNVAGRAAASGAVAAVVGIIVAGAWLLVRPSIAPGNVLRPLTFVVGAVILSRVFDVSPLTVLIAAAIAGWFWPGESP